MTITAFPITSILGSGEGLFGRNSSGWGSGKLLSESEARDIVNLGEDDSPTFARVVQGTGAVTSKFSPILVNGQVQFVRADNDGINLPFAVQPGASSGAVIGGFHSTSGATQYGVNVGSAAGYWLGTSPSGPGDVGLKRSGVGQLGVYAQNGTDLATLQANKVDFGNDFAGRNRNITATNSSLTFNYVDGLNLASASGVDSQISSAGWKLKGSTGISFHDDLFFPSNARQSQIRGGGAGEVGIYQGDGTTLGTLQAADIRANSFYAGPGAHNVGSISGGLSLKPNNQHAWMVNGYGSSGSAQALTTPGGTIGWSSLVYANALSTGLKEVAAGTVGVYQQDGVTLGTVQVNTVAPSSTNTLDGADIPGIRFDDANTSAIRYITGGAFDRSFGFVALNSYPRNLIRVGDGFITGSDSGVAWSNAPQTTYGTIDTRLKRAATGTVGVYGSDGTTPGTVQAASLVSPNSGLSLGTNSNNGIVLKPAATSAYDVFVQTYNRFIGMGTAFPNAVDLGRTNAPWRTGYFGTSVESPVFTNGTTAQTTIGNTTGGVSIPGVASVTGNVTCSASIVNTLGQYTLSHTGPLQNRGLTVAQSGGVNWGDVYLGRAAAGTVKVTTDGTTPGSVEAISVANGTTAQTTLGNATGGTLVPGNLDVDGMVNAGSNGALGGTKLNVFGTDNLAAFQTSSSNPGRVISIAGANVTGEVRAISTSISTTGPLRHYIQQNGTGDVGFERLLVGAGGDARDLYGVNGGTHWAQGLKRSDNTYRISASNDLGTGTALSIDHTTKKATFTGTVGAPLFDSTASGTYDKTVLYGSSPSYYLRNDGIVACTTVVNETANDQFLFNGSNLRMRSTSSIGLCPDAANPISTIADTQWKRASAGVWKATQSDGTTLGGVQAASFSNGITDQTSIGNATGGVSIAEGIANVESNSGNFIRLSASNYGVGVLGLNTFLRANGVNRVVANLQGCSVTGTLTSSSSLSWGGETDQRLNSGDWQSYESSLTAWQTGYSQEASASGVKSSLFGAPRVLQPAAIADSTADVASVSSQLNLLLQAARDIGLIST